MPISLNRCANITSKPCGVRCRKEGPDNALRLKPTPALSVGSVPLLPQQPSRFEVRPTFALLFLSELMLSVFSEHVLNQGFLHMEVRGLELLDGLG
jgi:hypothetical protein